MKPWSRSDGRAESRDERAFVHDHGHDDLDELYREMSEFEFEDYTWRDLCPHFRPWDRCSVPECAVAHVMEDTEWREHVPMEPKGPRRPPTLFATVREIALSGQLRVA